METRDQTDLARLDAFVHSIESASTLSAPAGKMHGLFQALYKIAARYIALATQLNQEEPPLPETEAQLAAIGFPHAQLHSQSSNPLDVMATQLFDGQSNIGDTSSDTHLGQSSVNPMFWMGNGAQLENWLYDNQMSMESLQDFEFDPS